LRNLPPNLTLTGFLETSSYGALLRSADVVVALTTEDHTMQRSAYEAIYQGTPVIVSDFPLLRDAFPEGAVHVDNTAEGIVDGLTRIAAHRAEYRAAAVRLRERKYARWATLRRELLQIIAADPPRTHVGAPQH
jgi:glycosyltransferase involved in cell wall biosynthesis